MQLVPPAYEQTPVRCSGCHTQYVSFVPTRNPSTDAEEYAPDRCSCGYLEDRVTLPPGKLFGAAGDRVKTFHPLNRPN